MSDEVGYWRALASQLDIKVTAPATVLLGDESVTFTALLPQFGGDSGMIADPQWEVISPYADALLKLGYAYSAVELGSDGDDDSARRMLRDWGWSAPEPKPGWW
ncbi:MAG TPA: hypothetical protein VFW19_13805 [Allosphingosinicella sp.]|nr:hypothetical protein [Allosphingosinicella sp.]